jgi:hypothetical protein
LSFSTQKRAQPFSTDGGAIVKLFRRKKRAIFVEETFWAKIGSTAVSTFLRGVKALI